MEGRGWAGWRCGGQVLGSAGTRVTGCGHPSVCACVRACVRVWCVSARAQEFLSGIRDVLRKDLRIGSRCYIIYIYTYHMYI